MSAFSTACNIPKLAMNIGRPMMAITQRHQELIASKVCKANSVNSMGIGQVIIRHSVKQDLLSVKETRRSNCHTVAAQFFNSMRMCGTSNTAMSHILPDSFCYLGAVRSLCKIPRYTKLCALISPPAPNSSQQLPSGTQSFLFTSFSHCSGIRGQPSVSRSLCLSHWKAVVSPRSGWQRTRNLLL